MPGFEQLMLSLLAAVILVPLAARLGLVTGLSMALSAFVQSFVVAVTVIRSHFLSLKVFAWVRNRNHAYYLMSIAGR